MAVVAATVLADPDRAARACDLTGPAVLSCDEVASVSTDVPGRSPRTVREFVEAHADEFRADRSTTDPEPVGADPDQSDAPTEAR